MRDIKGFKSPEPELICPMRKSGGFCVKQDCAWWHEGECSVRSIAKSLLDSTSEHGSYDPVPDPAPSNPFWPPLAKRIDDDDVPF